MSHRSTKCLPHVVAAWTGWVCPCGHDIADHAGTPEGYCLKCRCPRAYLGWQRAVDPMPRKEVGVTIDVNGLEMIEVFP